MSEEIAKCCANCEQGEPRKNKAGEVHRVLCTPFLTPWMKKILEDRVKDGEDDDSWTFVDATDGADCDCFIPRGRDR